MTRFSQLQNILCLCLILLLQACVSSPKHSEQSIHSKQSKYSKQVAGHQSSDPKSSDRLSIGPYSSFSGRLIVFDSERRWQVSLDWQAARPDTGKLRLSHALTGTVVDFRWTKDGMQVRDNKAPYWRPIQQQELAKHGIVIPPSQLASILLNQTPSHFQRIKHDTWQSTESGSPIQLRWQEKLHSLTIIDIQHHRTARLIIKSHADITRSR